MIVVVSIFIYPFDSSVASIIKTAPAIIAGAARYLQVCIRRSNKAIAFSLSNVSRPELFW